MAQLAAQRTDRLVAVIREFQPKRIVAGEIVQSQELTELSEARQQLLLLLKNRGIQAHTELDTALQECARLLARQPTITLRRLRSEYERLNLNEGLSLPDACAACYRLTGRLLTVSELRAVLRASGRDNPKDVKLTYDQLCSLVAELGAQAQSSHTTTNQNGADRFSQTLLYWKLAMFRTQQLLRIYVSNFIGIYVASTSHFGLCY